MWAVRCKIVSRDVCTLRSERNKCRQSTCRAGLAAVLESCLAMSCYWYLLFRMLTEDVSTFSTGMLRHVTLTDPPTHNLGASCL